ncbi:unnamed protein product [Colias eurytheme]|nr:unnamed protein product [Colias eurytheme]
MSTTATRHVKSSNSANILMCKQWWKVCWMYGDQEKYYRQLYGRRKINTNKGIFDDTDIKRPGAQITELTDDFFQDNVTQNPAPDERKDWFGAESEPIYGFEWQNDQRRKPINLDDFREILTDDSHNLPPNRVIDSDEQIHRNGDVIGKTSRTVSRTKKGALVTEETEICTDGRTTANLRFHRSTVKSAPNKVKEILQPLKEDAVLDECSRKKCVGDTLTTTTTTLVTVTQQMVTCCNE